MSGADPRQGGEMVDEVPLVLVQAGPHQCGLPAADVVEVVPAVRIAALPGAPAAVEGAINVRGTVVPVFDLRRRFGLASRPVAPQDRLVIMRSGERTIALRADHALDVITVSSDDLQEAPTGGADPDGSTGVVLLRDGLIVVCDPGTFLAGEDAIVLDELLAATDTDRA